MKIRVLTVLAALVLALTAGAYAQKKGGGQKGGGQSNGQAGDFAHGNGNIEFQDKISNFAFTAQRRQDGTVDGELVYNQRSATNPENNLSVHMRIDCLTITGKTATIQGIITQANPSFVLIDPSDPNSRFDLVGAAANMTVVDNGQGNSGEQDDQASSLYITGARSVFCTTVFPPEMYKTANVVVRSAQPTNR